MTAVVGLTGGIATGKSTVAELFRELGVPVVQADELAHEVMAPGGPAHHDLVQYFGPRVLGANGQVDRKWLGEVVFGDATKRAQLNAIVHPKVAELSAKRIAALKGSEAPYVVYEAALLVEVGRHKDFDALVVVHSDSEVQAQRLAMRDGLGPQAVKARLDAQASAEEKLAVADIVVHNQGTIADLRGEVLKVHEALGKRFGQGDTHDR